MQLCLGQVVAPARLEPRVLRGQPRASERQRGGRVAARQRHRDAAPQRGELAHAVLRERPGCVGAAAARGDRRGLLEKVQVLLVGRAARQHELAPAPQQLAGLDAPLLAHRIGDVVRVRAGDLVARERVEHHQPVERQAAAGRQVARLREQERIAAVGTRRAQELRHRRLEPRRQRFERFAFGRGERCVELGRKRCDRRRRETVAVRQRAHRLPQRRSFAEIREIGAPRRARRDPLLGVGRLPIQCGLARARRDRGAEPRHVRIGRELRRDETCAAQRRRVGSRPERLEPAHVVAQRRAAPELQLLLDVEARERALHALRHPGRDVHVRDLQRPVLELGVDEVERRPALAHQQEQPLVGVLQVIDGVVGAQRGVATAGQADVRAHVHECEPALRGRGRRGREGDGRERAEHRPPHQPPAWR